MKVVWRGGREGGRLEEVVWCPPCDMRLPSSGCRVKLQAEKERKHRMETKLVKLNLYDGISQTKIEKS